MSTPDLFDAPALSRIFSRPATDCPANGETEGHQRLLTAWSSKPTTAWQEERRVEWHNIAPGKPVQNGLVESFIGRVAVHKPAIRFRDIQPLQPVDTIHFTISRLAT